MLVGELVAEAVYNLIRDSSNPKWLISQVLLADFCKSNEQHFNDVWDITVGNSDSVSKDKLQKVLNSLSYCQSHRSSISLLPSFDVYGEVTEISGMYALARIPSLQTFLVVLIKFRFTDRGDFAALKVGDRVAFTLAMESDPVKYYGYSCSRINDIPAKKSVEFEAFGDTTVDTEVLRTLQEDNQTLKEHIDALEKEKQELSDKLCSESDAKIDLEANVEECKSRLDKVERENMQLKDKLEKEADLNKKLADESVIISESQSQKELSEKNQLDHLMSEISELQRTNEVLRQELKDIELNSASKLVPSRTISQLLSTVLEELISHREEMSTKLSNLQELQSHLERSLAEESQEVSHNADAANSENGDQCLSSVPESQSKSRHWFWEK